MQNIHLIHVRITSRTKNQFVFLRSSTLNELPFAFKIGRVACEHNKGARRKVEKKILNGSLTKIKLCIFSR